MVHQKVGKKKMLHTFQNVAQEVGHLLCMGKTLPEFEPQYCQKTEHNSSIIAFHCPLPYFLNGFIWV
jgi:hypothetical protein